MRDVIWAIFPDQKRGSIYASGHDITKRKRDEKLLLKAVETSGQANRRLAHAIEVTQKLAQQAETASRSKSAFLAVMSHELRTPLNGMLGSGQLLQTTRLDEEQRDYVELMMRCGETLKRLVDDVLDLSKIEAGHLTVSREPFDLDLLLRQVVQTFAPAAVEKNISLHRSQQELPQTVFGDPLRLRQVLSNLIGNAIKFTDRGGILVGISEISPLPEGELKVVFSVRDSGIGIAPEAQELLFEPFSQVDSSPTRNYGGAGLGLAICRKLVGLMKGEIWLTSEPNQGSIFNFSVQLGGAELEQTLPLPLPSLSTLPAKILAPEPSPTFHSASEEEMPLLSLPSYDHLRVLVVEDETHSQQIFLHFLGKVGIVFHLAQNGQEAIEYCLRETYDLILMDIQMPVLDGLAATEQIRRIEREKRESFTEDSSTPLPAYMVGISAHGMKTDRAHFLEAGLDDVLLKPIRFSELLSMLDIGAARSRGVEAMEESVRKR